MSGEAITAFRGRWTKLGNFSLCTVFYERHAYPSVEHAYQAAKFLDVATIDAQIIDRTLDGIVNIRRLIRHLPTPGLAKKATQRIKNCWRPDWHDVKVDVMHTLLIEKFAQEPERSILLSTGATPLVEGNYWHDNFWGDCRCRMCKEITGENWLGKLLMDVRDELREGVVPESEAI